MQDSVLGQILVTASGLMICGFMIGAVVAAVCIAFYVPAWGIATAYFDAKLKYDKDRRKWILKEMKAKPRPE